MPYSTAIEIYVSKHFKPEFSINFWRIVFENTHLEISDYLLIILDNNHSCFNEIKDVFRNKNFRQSLIKNQYLIENLITLASFKLDQFLEFSREIINTDDIEHFYY